MTSVQDQAFYGWPWSYYGQHVDPRLNPPRPDMVEIAIKPDYALSSHVAALGLAFSMGMAMPQDFANGAFVGNRGSWNRDHFNGYKVLYVPFENGKPAGQARDVVTGFLNGNEEARGRPVGLGFDGTGALLIADDAGNTVWRVAADGGTPLAEPLGTDQMPQGSPVARERAAGADAVGGAPVTPNAATSPAGTTPQHPLRIRLRLRHLMHRPIPVTERLLLRRRHRRMCRPPVRQVPSRMPNQLPRRSRHLPSPDASRDGKALHTRCGGPFPVVISISVRPADGDHSRPSASATRPRRAAAERRSSLRPGYRDACASRHRPSADWPGR